MMKEKAELIESINSLLKDISELEREKRGNRVYHEFSSVKPITFDRDEKNKAWDSLARLLDNKGETCVALSYADSKLLIASNNEEVKEYTKKHLEALKKYAQSPFKHQYENLLITSIVEFLRLIEYVLSTKSDSNAKKLNKSFKKILGSEGKEISKLIWIEVEGEREKWKIKSDLKCELDKPELNFDRVCESVKILNIDKLLLELMDLFSNIGETEAINPLKEANFIANAILEEEFSELAEIVVRNNVEYIRGSEKLHAEMKLLQRVWSGEAEYIGISKKCCVPCYKSFEVLGKIDKICGTHGDTFFEGAWTPSEISDDFLTELLNSLERVKRDISDRKSGFLGKKKGHEKTKSQLEALEKKGKLNSNDKQKKLRLENELKELEKSREDWPYTKGSQSTAEVDETIWERPLTSKYRDFGELERKIVELKNDKIQLKEFEKHYKELEKVKSITKIVWIQKVNDLKWELGIAPELLKEGIEWENNLKSKESLIETEEYGKKILIDIYRIAGKEAPIYLQNLETKMEFPLPIK